MQLFLLLSVVTVASCTFVFHDASVTMVPGVDNVSGELKLYTTQYGVLIVGHISGLTPGLHGFHVHENGDLSDRCSAAGGHFNPLMAPRHGSPYDLVRHAGDLGNVLAGPDGVARIYIHDVQISLNPNAATYIGGLAFVVHQGRDDLGRGGDEGSLASGNAGSRSGCGLIQVS